MNKETQIARKAISSLKNKYGKNILIIRTNGEPAGIPDYIVSFFGRFVGLEAKTPTGKLSKIQKYYKEKIKKTGAYYIVFRSVEDCLEQFEKLFRRLSYGEGENR